MLMDEWDMKPEHVFAYLVVFKRLSCGRALLLDHRAQQSDDDAPKEARTKSLVVYKRSGAPRTADWEAAPSQMIIPLGLQTWDAYTDVAFPPETTQMSAFMQVRARQRKKKPEEPS